MLLLEPYEPPDTTWKSMWTEEKEGSSDAPQPQLQRALKIEPQPARDQVKILYFNQLVSTH